MRRALPALLLTLASACNGNPFVPDYRYCPAHAEMNAELTLRLLEQPRTISIYGSIRLIEKVNGVEVTSPAPTEATLHWDLGIYSMSSGGDTSDFSLNGDRRITLREGRSATYLGSRSGGPEYNQTDEVHYGAYAFTCATLENLPRLELTGSDGREATLTEARIVFGVPAGATNVPTEFLDGRGFRESVSESQGLHIIATFTIGE